MKKFFEIPQLAIESFASENIVTGSAAMQTYERDKAQFTIGTTANDNFVKVLDWSN